MSEREYPGGDSSTDGAGFAAVRAKYGPDMVVRIRNWARLAAVYHSDVKQAERDVERARNDRDFALEQAASIARKIPRRDWTLVPTRAQLDREWDLDGAGKTRTAPDLTRLYPRDDAA